MLFLYEYLPTMVALLYRDKSMQAIRGKMNKQLERLQVWRHFDCLRNRIIGNIITEEKPDTFPLGTTNEPSDIAVSCIHNEATKSCCSMAAAVDIIISTCANAVLISHFSHKNPATQ